jgi:hypothetical protein
MRRRGKGVPGHERRFPQGQTLTNAALVVTTVVRAGISGGEFGVRGRIGAFDALDRHEPWRTGSTGGGATA